MSKFSEGSNFYYQFQREYRAQDNPYVHEYDRLQWENGFLHAYFEQDRTKLKKGSKMKSQIILIRHGESLGNLSQRYFEVHDSANILTQKGVEQCLTLRDTLAGMMPRDDFGTHTTVISSKHQRAKLTAEIVMQGSHLPILHDARLNECWHESDSKIHGTFENVESRRFVVDRVRRLVDQYEFNLILFCHGVLMDVLEPREEREVANCEMRVYDRKDFIERILK